MARRWSLRRVLLGSLIGALALSALVGIYIFIVGDFGETEIKILVTTLSLSYFSVTSLGCTLARERERAIWLAAPGLALSGVGFVWSLLMIWAEWDSEVPGKTMVVLILFAFSFAQSSLLSLAPLKGRLFWVFVAALVHIFALAILLSVMLIFELDDEFLFRLAGVLGILDAAGTLSVPILYKLGGGRPAEKRPPEETVQDQDRQIDLSCPGCGHRNTCPVGLIVCPKCSLAIRVTVVETGNHAGGRPFQFRLKTMMLVFLAVSLPLGWIGFRIGQLRAQAALAKQLEDLNLSLNYRYGNLYWVSFIGTDADRFDASVLARLKRLPKLTHVDLQGMPITDDDLAYLEGMRLEAVYLADTRITDAGLARLESLIELSHLDVSNTAVTAEGVEKLRRKIPNLSVTR